MHTFLYHAVAAVCAYLIGAIPSGYLLARARGVDIRCVGSGNVGATNVFRSVSKPLGILTFFADALKGFLPVFFARLAARRLGLPADGISALQVLSGLCAIVGHNWPVYLRFKGGKGVATTAGVLLAIAPAAVGAGFVVWAVVFLTTRYVSVASIVTAAVVAALSWLLRGGDARSIPATMTLLAVLVVWRHQSNIRRLLNGTEHRFSLGRRRQATGQNENTGIN